MENSAKTKPISGKAVALFCVVAFFWFALDRITKAMVFDAAVGQVLVPDVLGLFEFRLIHNTGAAWGVFSDSTFALGIFNVVLCAVITCVLFIGLRGGTIVENISLALVVAGGLGNAFDRFIYGYVVDFINCTFINFPVFNVADIGVTCGIAIFLVAWIFNESKHGKTEQGSVEEEVR